MAAISAARGVNADPPRSLDVVGYPSGPGNANETVNLLSRCFRRRRNQVDKKDREILATVKVFRVTKSPISSDSAMQNPTTGPSNLKSDLSVYGQQSSQRLGTQCGAF
jgi:hypothetical protein